MGSANSTTLTNSSDCKQQKLRNENAAAQLVKQEYHQIC